MRITKPRRHGGTESSFIFNLPGAPVRASVPRWFNFVHLIFLILFVSPVHAFGQRDIGTTGAQFLKIGISPRLAALGEAYGAMGNDVSSIFSNPAGVGFISRKEVQFVHAQLIADIMLNSIFYGHPLPEPFGNLAFNYVVVDYGTIDRTTLNAPDGSGNPAFGKNGTFSAHDQALSVAYAHHFELFDRTFHWGMTGKLIQQRIDAETANGFAYDAGILYVPPGRNWRAGVTIQNLGYLSRFRTEADPLPLNVKFSGGANFSRDRLRLGMDINVPVDNSPYVNFGAEVLPIPQVALRAGYRYDNSTTDFVGYTAGLGVMLANISLDYAYVPFELLGANHRFGLSAKFGGTTEKPMNRSQNYMPPTPPPPARITSNAAYVWEAPPVITAAPAPNGLIKGVWAMPFRYAGGPADYSWLAEATHEVLRKDWARKQILNPSGSYLVDGEAEVIGSRLILRARMTFKGRTIGTFEAMGDADAPFPAWAELQAGINGRLASFGM